MLGGEVAVGVGQIGRLPKGKFHTGYAVSGGGGGAGAYAESLITSGFSGAAVTVGAAGAGQLGTGLAGGTSSFGAFVTCTGGARWDFTNSFGVTTFY